MINKLFILSSYLNTKGFVKKSDEIRRLIKVCSIPGVDHPSEEIDIDDVNDAITYLEENPGLTLLLDYPKGSHKWESEGSMLAMPFHYGEVIQINNPADDMGWDVVIAPEATQLSEKSKEADYIPAGHNLLPVGYLPINLDRELWAKETVSIENPEGKEPPAGNDKIILAPNGRIKESDKADIKKFFDKIWNFNKPIWL